MREELLHFIWENRKLPWRGLRSKEGEPIQVHDPGERNRDAGPDFLQADISIGELRWSGPVEIHIKASDWYAHGHQDDPNYRNVILHLVWDDDTVVCTPSGAVLPTVALRHFIDPSFLRQCKDLLDQGWTRFIPCETYPKPLASYALRHWWEGLYAQRLKRKGEEVKRLLELSRNHWEEVLFRLLARSFGARVNREAFGQLALSIPFPVIRKLQGNPSDLEALFFGMSGLLEPSGPVDKYQRELWKRFRYIRRKFRLQPSPQARPEFFRLRPQNFPTIRLAQLAALYGRRTQLFSQVLHAPGIDALHTLLDVPVSSYWESHFLFGKAKRKAKNRLSRTFKDLILLNTIFPMRAIYFQMQGKDIHEQLLELASQLPAEQNRMVRGFREAGLPVTDALGSQAILQQFESYCQPGRCLECMIGNRILYEL